ncbi:MAG TPA: hypothetical protein VGG72_27605 [Bryobacteraceae bacterium]|jgi:hypothetical protein
MRDWAYIGIVDPLNAITLYATSSGVRLSLPSSEVLDVAINPSNHQILCAGTFDQGTLKSTACRMCYSPIHSGILCAQ